MKANLIGCDTLPCVCSDHDFIMMQLNIQNGTGTTFGKSYWKFNDELLEDKAFVSAFKIFWKISSKTETKDLNWWDRMKLNIKLFCIDYSKSKNKSLYGELKLLKQKYNRLNLKQTSDLKLLDEIKTRVKEIETSLSKGSLIRSKAKDLETNENPSSYFFQKEVFTSKAKTVKTITHNNVSYSSSSDILTCFKSFYESLYDEEPVDSSLNDLFLNDLPQVDFSDNNFLKNKINKTDILSSLKNKKPHKSPGSDGLSSSFYLTILAYLVIRWLKL